MAIGARRFSWVDLVVAAAVVVVLYGVLVFGRDAAAAFDPTAPSIDTSLSQLPYYAFRSLARMFMALAASYMFTLAYAYAAARSRRLGTVLIPALDILQSVPVLGFLSITVTGFIALLPGSMLGLEMAAIFAIFTSQAWNLTFSFYHSLQSQPRDLDEVARLMQLSRWRRFWKLDVPNGAIGLVWNGMMSMGGGWFFLVASEAISVNNQTFTLPGVGSYAATAIDDGDLGRVAWALTAMAVMVLAVSPTFVHSRSPRRVRRGGGQCGSLVYGRRWRRCRRGRLVRSQGVVGSGGSVGSAGRNRSRARRRCASCHASVGVGYGPWIVAQRSGS